ncbi:MAG: hypothetical protein JOZ69_19750 [Myxococcales bacterium]|nr:hypothetical protein [Myxococcales bacterium]
MAMTHLEDELSETVIEERDGATWLSGLCPFCWERYAFPAPPDGETAVVSCPEGHVLRIADRHSARAFPNAPMRAR